MKYYYKDIELDVPKSVYGPQEDSELMTKCLENIDLQGKSVLEIGCGSGLLSIIMAKKGANVTAVDIDPIAVKATVENAMKNGTNVNAFESDLFSSITGAFDLTVFNPPYLPVEEGDLTYSGGKTGRETIEKFVARVKNHLKPGGFVLLLISSLTGEKEVIELFSKEGMKTSVIAREKVPWEELVMLEAHL